MQQFQIGSYHFYFNREQQVKVIDEPGSYHGISFSGRRYHYEILEGLVGLRLLINSIDPNNHLCRDLPLNDKTLHFLPDCVIIERI